MAAVGGNRNPALTEEEENELDENAVRVCVRVRPMSELEYSRGDIPNACVLSDDRTMKVKVETEGRRKIETHHYQFDHTFDASTSQEEVFQESGAERFCDVALRGSVSTIFCFGQTGSGKTYTMSGPVSEGEACVAAGLAADPESVPLLGVQYRAVHYITRRVADLMNTEGIEVSLKASFIEIYNETVNDLLDQDAVGLKVRWAQQAQSFFVENLMIVRCDNLDDLLAVLEEGNSNRKRASHRLNIDSSRSHVIFTVYCEIKKRGSRAPPKLGKINFVDLAGSERLKESGSTGVNAKETKSINKSLFALGNVIQSLAQRDTGALDKKEAGFIPYRDSTLTKLLMDSLGGACKTLMIACVTPSVVYTDETVSTLKYATRASNIINLKAKIRTDPQEQLVFELRTEIDLLKQENEALKAKLMTVAGGGHIEGISGSRGTSGGTAQREGTGGEMPRMAPTPPDESIEFQQAQDLRWEGGGGGVLRSQVPQQQQAYFGDGQPQQQQQFNQQHPPSLMQTQPPHQQTEQLVGEEQSKSSAGSGGYAQMYRRPSVGKQTSSWLKGQVSAQPSPIPDVNPTPSPAGLGEGRGHQQLQPLQHTPPVPAQHPTPTMYSTEQKVALDVAERIQNDNERLREEVAQLRNLVLSSRASSPLKRQGSSVSALSGTSNQLGSGGGGGGIGGGTPPGGLYDQLPPPSASSMNSDGASYGFKRVPSKRAARLALLPMSDANNTQMTNMTTHSAPNIPTSDPPRTGLPPRSAVTPPSPSFDMGGGGGGGPLPAGSASTARTRYPQFDLNEQLSPDSDFRSMRQQLEQAQRDMLLARLQGKPTQ